MPISQNLLNKLIRQELEKLGLAKKYTGFKYITDLLEILLSNPLMDLAEGFGKISKLNDVSLDTFEHAIKNMLFNCLRQSEILQNTVGEYSNKDIKSIINTLKDIVYRAIA